MVSVLHKLGIEKVEISCGTVENGFDIIRTTKCCVGSQKREVFPLVMRGIERIS